MSFSRVPARIPPTVSLVASDSSVFWRNVQSKYTNTIGDVTDCPYTYCKLNEGSPEIKGTGYLFNFTGDSSEQKTIHRVVNFLEWGGFHSLW